MEKFPQIADTAIEKADIRKVENEKERPKYTAVDFFAIPERITATPESFLEWFESRFGQLKEVEDFQRVSGIIQEALEVIKEQPYLLSPRINKDFPVSPSVERWVRNGFSSLDEIRGFFQRVAVENKPENSKEFLSPNRKSDAGAVRLSVCRILSVAYVLETIRESYNFEKFLEYTQSVFDRGGNGKEMGIFGSLDIGEGQSINVIQKPQGEMKVMEWLFKEQSFKGCRLNNIGERGSDSFYFSEVVMGIKSGARTFHKLLRDPRFEGETMADFFRMSFVLPDKASQDDIITFLHSLQEEARKKTDPQVEMEFMAQNYFTPEEIEEFFPEVLDAKLRKGFLDKITIKSNPSSGEKFKHVKMIVALRHPGENKPFFSFEVTAMREGEYKANKNIEDSAFSHFSYEADQLARLISRLNGPLYEEEWSNLLARWLNDVVPTEKMPKKLEAKNGNLFAFSGTIKEKAQTLLRYLIDSGAIKKVTPAFPSKGMPTKKQKEAFPLYIHSEQMKRLLDVIGAERKFGEGDMLEKVLKYVVKNEAKLPIEITRFESREERARILLDHLALAGDIKRVEEENFGDPVKYIYAGKIENILDEFLKKRKKRID